MMIGAVPVWRLLLDTIRDPAEVARILLRLELKGDILWMALGLVVTLSVLVAAVLGMAVPASEELSEPPIALTPFMYAMILGGSLIIMVFALHFTGLMLGGQARFEDTLTLVVWLQFLLLALQVAQTATFLLMPPLAGMATIAAIAIVLWVLVNFINEGQRFGSLGRAAATSVLAILGMGLGLSFLISLITAGL